jgi:hypothetical protein
MNFIVEVFNKHGKDFVKKLALALGEALLPLIIERVKEGFEIFTEWILEKFKAIVSTNYDNLSEHAQMNAENFEMEANATFDNNAANVLRAKAEVWREVVELIVKQDLLTQEQINNLKTIAMEKANNPLEGIDLEGAINEAIQLPAGVEN